jgi:RNA polymerase sigma-70 factor (ECF subfamily)
VYAYAGGQREVADDAVAEAFARAMSRDGEVRDPLAYLYRIAFRVASAELTRRKREEADVPEQQVADPNQNGTTDLFGALRTLSPAQRAAVYLHYRVDLPVREVAHLTGMSTAAVKVHLMRGRRRLRELLGTEDDA